MDEGFRMRRRVERLPSQVHPWRMRPTIRDVHWLHLVGVLNDFTTNWWALGCGG